MAFKFEHFSVEAIQTEEQGLKSTNWNIQIILLDLSPLLDEMEIYILLKRKILTPILMLTAALEHRRKKWVVSILE